MSAPSVGVDDLNLYGSTLAIDVADIARARGTPVEDLTRLELVRRSIAPSFEDPVTLAVNAAKPLVDRYGKDAFGMLLVATESGVDHAKPLSSYVHHHLDLTPGAFHVELKHACFAATAGLQLAASWVQMRPDQRVLLIATDMARKIFGEPAEGAGGGAGAVAMAVTANPRVLALDSQRGFFTREVYDVMRPNPRLERSYGDVSMAAYLDLVEGAWTRYREAVGPGALDRLDHMIFHTPVIPLVREAHRVILDIEDWKHDVAEDFARRVRPSLRYCQETNNLYSGSLYSALAGLIDGLTDLAGSPRVGMYSYGSGSGACYFSGVLGAEAKAVLARHAIAAHLGERRSVDVVTYERTILENERGLTERSFTPDREIVPAHYDGAYRGRGRLVLEGVEDYYRSYRWS